MQQLNVMVAPVDEEVSSELQDANPPSSLFDQIRSALVENNTRARSNENFLAAANHFLGSASAERQTLGMACPPSIRGFIDRIHPATLINGQREENERMMAQFAVRESIWPFR